MNGIRLVRRRRGLRSRSWTEQESRWLVLGWECLEGRRMLAADFGDAPAPYATATELLGAWHETTTSLHLGAAVDSELEGLPSLHADGDGTDDDGVTFQSMRVGMLGVTTEVTVVGSEGKLDAWIDFNRDGSWGGAGEHVFDSVPVSSGRNLLHFDVPGESVVGFTYARFRLSTTGDLGFVGGAPDGEVEDYYIELHPNTTTPGLFAVEQVTARAIGGRSVASGDLDRDGDVDLVSGSYLTDTVTWYENLGNSFVPHVVANDADGVLGIDVVDLDGDGDLDLVAANSNQDSLFWYENDGQQQFGRHVVTTTADGIQSVRGADLDRDGDLDLICSSFLDDSVRWFENDGRENFTAHTVTSVIDGVISADAVDLDRDGDLDLLVASPIQGEVRLFENDGLQGFTSRRIVSATDVRVVKTIDLDKDGDLDVLTGSAATETIQWHENLGDQQYVARVISTSARGVQDLLAADFDGDGDLDVAAALFLADEVTWYERGPEDLPTFSPRKLSTLDGPRALLVTDLENDGDLDLAAISSVDNQVVWYRNLDPIVQLESGVVEGDEGTTQTLSVTSNRVLTARGIVDLVISGDGIDSTDYQITDAEPDRAGIQVEILAGESVGHFQLTLIDDGLPERDETLTITLANPQGIIEGIGQKGSQSLVIHDVEFPDFGDAPTPYPTRRSEQGPSHQRFGPVLGDARDGEPDGVPSIGADADGGDDDGVQFRALRVGARDGEAIVRVSQANGKIDAWMDFNQDGSWGGPEEHILISQSANVGENRFRFSVPPTAQAGTTYARFRISSMGGLGIGGGAVDGEVEDYVVEISEAWGNYYLNASFPIGGSSLEVNTTDSADVDRDGDLDILVSRASAPLLWQENLGDGNFAERWMSNETQGMSLAIAADLDGDGRDDVIATSPNQESIRWFRNVGGFQFASRSVGSASGGVTALSTADMDHDGDIDLLAAENAGRSIVWYENHRELAFTRRTLASSPEIISTLVATDMDADGDLDVASTAFAGDQIVWYEQTNDRVFINHIVDQRIARPIGGLVTDFDLDGDSDIVAASFADHTIYWYENQGERNFVRRAISTETSRVSSLLALDVDGDRDWDLAYTVSDTSSVAWIEQVSSLQFERHLISKEISGAHWIDAVDLDSDNDMEWIVSGQNDDSLVGFDERNELQFSVDSQRVVEGIATTIRVSSQFAVRQAEAIELNVSGKGVSLDDFQLQDERPDLPGVQFLLPAGATSRAIELMVPLDGLIEPNENAELTLVVHSPGLRIVSQPIHVELVNHEPTDFGDAPLPYRTRRVDSGAEHGATGPRLGSSRDVDLDATPSARADSDDRTGETEVDDGITFGDLQVGQTRAQVRVYVDGGPAKLDAWLDLNQDGTWGGAREQILFSQPVISGENLFEFDLPAASAPGETFARFRLSTSGGLGINGPAVDGEVEDVLVEIKPPSWSSGIFAIAHTNQSSLPPALGVTSADIDRDGDVDVFATYNDRTLWLENDRVNRQFIQRVLSNSISFSTLAIDDLDGDGDLDVLAGWGDSDSQIHWFENRGRDGLTLRSISVSLAKPGSLAIADVDQDGDVDIFSVSRDTGAIVWHENMRSAQFTEKKIADGLILGGLFQIVDVDRDGELDLLEGSANEVRWLRNRGDQTFATPVTLSQGKSFTGSAIDFDRDGDIDVVGLLTFSPNQLEWLENIGSAQFRSHLIAVHSSYRGVHLQPADIDGDGDWDLVTSESRDFRNLGGQAFQFVPHVNPYFGSSAVADLDGDGDLDLTYGYSLWLENAPGIRTTLSTTRGSEADQTKIVATVETSHSSLTDSFYVIRVSGEGVDSQDYLLTDDEPDVEGFQVRIPAGGTKGSFEFTVLNDDVIEVAETVVLHVYSPRTLPFDENSIISTMRLTLVDDELADYGSAPFPYPATAHGLRGPRLGDERDADTTPDDGEEEDGAKFSGFRRGSMFSNVEITTSGAGFLIAWIDFDRDGVWENEEIILNQQIETEGVMTNNYRFRVPINARVGRTYARIRYSSTRDGISTIVAPDGEVEDYAIDVLPTLSSSGIFVRSEKTGPYVPSPQPGGHQTDRINVDLDGDGDQDTYWTNERALTFLINEGNNQHTLREITFFVATDVVDFDRDGDFDILASSGDSQVIMYNNGQNAFASSSISLPRYTSVADFDSDGDLDLGNFNGMTAGWIENRKEGLVPHFMGDVPPQLVLNLEDVDGDFDPDILGWGPSNSLIWLENDGNRQLIRHDIGSIPYLVDWVRMADPDDDGDLDLYVGYVRLTSSFPFVFFEHLLFEQITTLGIVAPEQLAVSEGDTFTLTVRTQRTSHEPIVAYVEIDPKSLEASEFVAPDDDPERPGTQVRVVIPAGELSGSVPIVFPDDTLFEGVGEIGLTLVGYTGIATIERLETTPLTLQIVDDEQGDFGDAPTPYPVSRRDNGPAHQTTGPYLGSARSPELDGISMPNSDGSENDDGVTFGTIRVGQQNASLLVHVQGLTSGTAKLDAWIDFGGDGSWGDASDRIFASHTVSAGDNVLTFDVPNVAISGTTYARFRLSTMGSLGIQGTAVDGEVEDYELTIQRPSSSIGPSDTPIPLASQVQAFDLQSVDVDQDGDVDLVASTFSRTMIWLENDGRQNFTSHNIGSTDSRPKLASAIDLDQDGDLDLLQTDASGTYWWENDGDQNFTSHPLTKDINPRSLEPSDIDQDGDWDLITTFSTNVVWLRNDGKQNFTQQLIDNLATSPKSALAVDIDSDGDIDLASVSFSGIAWYENLGGESFSKRVLNSKIRDATIMTASTMMDRASVTLHVASCSTRSHYIYSSIRGSSFFETKKNISCQDALVVADLNGDGQSEVISSEPFQPQQPTRIISSDLDGDGDLDLLTASGSGEIVWHPTKSPVNLPTLASIQLENGTRQRSRVSSVTVTFQGRVDLAADPFMVTIVSPDSPIRQVVPATTSISSFIETTVATIQFAVSPQARLDGGLVDGNYQLTIDGSKVSWGGISFDGDQDGKPGGNLLFGDREEDRFFALLGDFDGSGIVDFVDFLSFSSQFGRLRTDLQQEEVSLDLDWDGVVGFTDFLVFAGNFGRRRSAMG